MYLSVFLRPNYDAGKSYNCVCLSLIKLFHGVTFYVPRSKISADLALFAEIRDRLRRFLLDGEHCPPTEPGQCRLRGRLMT